MQLFIIIIYTLFLQHTPVSPYGYCQFYKYDGSTFTQLSDIPQKLNSSCSADAMMCISNNDLYVFINNSSDASISSTNNYTYKYVLSDMTFDKNTIILQRGETGNGVHQTAFADLTKDIIGNNNRFISGFDDVWYFGTDSFEQFPMYYGDGTQWIKFKN